MGHQYYNFRYFSKKKNPKTPSIATTNAKFQQTRKENNGVWSQKPYRPTVTKIRTLSHRHFLPKNRPSLALTSHILRQLLSQTLLSLLSNRPIMRTSLTTASTTLPEWSMPGRPATSTLTFGKTRHSWRTCTLGP